MNILLNEYFRFDFELNIKLNHFWARYISVGSYDELSDQGYTSLPKSDESESGQMVLK